MKALQIDKYKAKQLYKTAPKELKTILKYTFGEKFFTVSITDRIKTYEDACVETGEDPIKEKDMLKLGFTRDEIVYRKIKNNHQSVE